MRAAVVRGLGEAPQLGELPDAERGSGEALVEVRAAALNPIDIAIAAGRFHAGPPHVPYAPGREGVGLVRDSARVAAGTRVRFERDVGYGANGSLAELIAVDDDALIPLPDGVADEVAAALGIAGLAAWLALEKAAIPPGGTVIVLGATGAVGQVAVQGAKLFGAQRVVAAGRDAQALGRARALGADATVELSGDIASSLLEAAGGEVDAVIDPLWGEPAVAALRTLRVGGRLVHLGTSAGLEAVVPSAAVRAKNVTIVGHSNLTTPHDKKRQAYGELLDHIVAGRLDVDFEVFPLDRIDAAWQAQASSPHRKLVVRVS
ncbi:MAG: zinc-binding dehydrogenase [Actinobacteria bacterium]|nr:MAG: zinc-binding dehydrogenase [Actinomycetota bacterium]